MDPSTSSAQSTVDNQPMTGRIQAPTLAGQPGALSQSSPATSVPTPRTISVHPEQGPIQTGASQDADAEDELIMPAKQEVSTKTYVQQAPVEVMQQTAAQEIEVRPSTPELQIEKSIEHVVEKSPDMEKPKLHEAVKAVGVTHSGPGIPVDQNVFNIKTMPMTYEQAVAEEKLHPKLNDSKHWLAELIMYVWRKLDPTYGKTKGVTK